MRPRFGRSYAGLMTAPSGISPVAIVALARKLMVALWLIAALRGGSHRFGLSPAECGIMVTVTDDRTGDKVMRTSPHAQNRGRPDDDALRSLHSSPPCKKEISIMTKFPLDLRALR